MLRKARVAAILLAAMGGGAAARPAPELAVVVNKHSLWRSMHWAGRANTESSGIEAEREDPQFVVYEAGKRHVWIHYLTLPVSVRRYPFLVLTYRACVRNPGGGYIIWLDDGTGPDRGGFVAIRGSDLVGDGAVREIRRDMREFHPKGDIIGIALGMCAGVEPPGILDLVELRFEAAADAPAPGPHRPDRPIQVTVVDQAHQPVPDARVIVDAERTNFARTAVTDAWGRAALTPLANRHRRHTVRVEKEGWVVTETPRGGVSGKTSLRLTLTPGCRYGGVILNDAGRPVPGVGVHITASVGRVRGQITRCRELVLSDANGRWLSPLLPSRLGRLSFRLTHPDYRPGSTFAIPPNGPMGALHKGEGVFVLQRGPRIGRRDGDALGLPPGRMHTPPRLALMTP